MPAVTAQAEASPTEAPTIATEAPTAETEAPTMVAAAAQTSPTEPAPIIAAAAQTSPTEPPTMIATELLAAAPAPAPATSVNGDPEFYWDFSPWPEQWGYDRVDEVRIQAPNPAVIRIPRIKVDAPIIPLGLNDDGTIEVPKDPEETGWWLGGPEPGETGPAVIIGHVDSYREGPAVFFYLKYLEAGDEIHIDRVDGSTVSYVVDFSESHDKDAFPTDAVYGPTEQPTLRLVTCGGPFDRDVRSYEENVIVFASLA